MSAALKSAPNNELTRDEMHAVLPQWASVLITLIYETDDETAAEA